MRILFLILALSLPAAAWAQLPPPPPAPAPGVTLTLAELDALIQAAADTPARWSFQSLQLLLAKRQALSAPSRDEPKAP